MYSKVILKPKFKILFLRSEEEDHKAKCSEDMINKLTTISDKLCYLENENTTLRNKNIKLEAKCKDDKIAKIQEKAENFMREVNELQYEVKHKFL